MRRGSRFVRGRLTVDTGVNGGPRHERRQAQSRAEGIDGVHTQLPGRRVGVTRGTACSARPADGIAAASRFAATCRSAATCRTIAA